MTRSEAEELFVAAVLSGATVAVEMTLKEAQVFRVLVGRTLKEMEAKNRALWLRARDYGIEYKEPHAVIRKFGGNRFRMFKVEENGTLTDLIPLEEEVVVSKKEEAENEQLQ